MNMMNNPLINKVLDARKKEEISASLDKFKTLSLNNEQVTDAKNVSRGIYSPLTGFLRKEDFNSVVSEMRLTNGTVWPIPIVLDITDEIYQSIQGEKNLILVDEGNRPVAFLKNSEIFEYNRDFFAKNVFGTLNREHPGVEGIYKMGRYLIGGEIELLDNSKKLFPEYNFTPQETKKIFQEKGWKTVVAFQTRNVPHRSHEFLQKRALQKVDGLFIQPVIGEKKLKDFKDEYILASYEILINEYYPKNRVVLGILPLKMRYAGPREAVFHALVRRNFGCTHFIVGRDHAGVGGYYPPLAAQEIFNRFEKEEIGIEILKCPEVVYCTSCQGHVFKNECQHQGKISLSGTKLREFIKNKEQPPSCLLRPEVYNLLLWSDSSLVDLVYKRLSLKNQKGFVLWFTGFPQSGKTTIADKVFEILKERNLKVERLDGDIVRRHLSRDLGFSKEDRDENIRRVGFMAKFLSTNRIGVIASFISPYRLQRDKLRREAENFIEVFCNCPLEICEKRDKKGLYQKAREGKIRNFTGVSDPYEPPESPELELKTGQKTVVESVDKVIKYLEENDYLQ